ncbi:hypothetical protein [Pseudomonas sp. EMN2]|uniref:hypothetical protein n=1 Tax=Pseudomonas sp. EMN2 TaxID=2615212 RepID=UPI00129B59E3|nr:hypothetical protein [Pseudomonas sp. EMN2]
MTFTEQLKRAGLKLLDGERRFIARLTMGQPVEARDVEGNRYQISLDQDRVVVTELPPAPAAIDPIGAVQLGSFLVSTKGGKLEVGKAPEGPPPVQVARIFDGPTPYRGQSVFDKMSTFSLRAGSKTELVRSLGDVLPDARQLRMSKRLPGEVYAVEFVSDLKLNELKDILAKRSTDGYSAVTVLSLREGRIADNEEIR